MAGRHACRPGPRTRPADAPRLVQYLVEKLVCFGHVDAGLVKNSWGLPEPQELRFDRLPQALLTPNGRITNLLTWLNLTRPGCAWCRQYG